MHSNSSFTGTQIIEMTTMPPPKKICRGGDGISDSSENIHYASYRFSLLPSLFSSSSAIASIRAYNTVTNATIVTGLAISNDTSNPVMLIVKFKTRSSKKKAEELAKMLGIGFCRQECFSNLPDLSST